VAKPKRARTARREAARGFLKVAKDRERLFMSDAGGSSARPIDVETPSVVEVRARGVPCPLCGGEHEVVEHAAVMTESGSLREARLRCRRCGSKRSLWFRILLPS
jgi:DNA-directed RNA polymerase subunit RPC12/RpoP